MSSIAPTLAVPSVQTCWKRLVYDTCLLWERRSVTRMTDSRLMSAYHVTDVTCAHAKLRQ